MRARGANARLAMKYEATYGVAPTGNYHLVPFASANLGDEQGLIPSDLLGYGRDPQQPSRDVVNNAGDVVVPVDVRNLGLWLKLLMGAATVTTGLAATGSISFTDQPANNATITVGGQAFTFTDTAPSANQIAIGATLAETVANAVRALNASAVAGVAAASYRAGANGAVILIEHDALGTSGNSFALAAGSTPASNATVSAATLAGGAALGAKHHAFVPGALTLPSAAIEVGMPEVPDYGMNTGVKANTFGVQMQRSGLLSATVGLIGQAETTDTESQAGTPTEMAVERFSQFSGVIRREGVPIGDLVTGQLNLTNGLDPVEVIRGDGRIAGADEGMVALTGQMGVRFSSRELLTLAENGTAVELEFEWTIPDTAWRFRVTAHNVYLPKAKKPVTGPAGVQADYAWQASKHPTLAKTGTFVLTNDVASY